MGGFVGFTDGGNVDIDNCMNLANITRSGENVSEKLVDLLVLPNEIVKYRIVLIMEK